MVEFRGVSKVYAQAVGGRVRALLDATFLIRDGEMVVVSGPTGAGKTTLLRLASGQERPTRGTVLVDGDDVGALGRRSLARLRRGLAVVPQEPRLVAERTAVGNVAIVLRALGVARGEARARALEALREVGLAARANALPLELAAGERQRLLIARALATVPRLLLADEPLAALDDAEAGGLVKVLRAVNTRGTTVIVATRAARLAAEIGVRALTLDCGRVRVSGDPHGSA